ncbi:enoyl-CoA hydratase/isomerase family protein [Bradyrhizobium sp. RDT10]
MSQDSSAPLLTKESATAIVTLQRPVQANRLQQEDVIQLRSYWDLLKEDTTIRAVVLTSAGKHFSAGYDMNSILDTSHPDPDGDGVENAFASMVDALERLPR